MRRITLMAAAAMAVAWATVGCAAGPRVALTDSGAVLVDGKPFLPIFAWAQPSSALELHKSLGVNTLHPGETADKDPPGAYLDKLRANGMLALMNMELMSDETRGHPAVLAWTVEHEPDVAQPAAYEPNLSGDAAAVWIEGEAAAENTLKPSPWLDVKTPRLSGGRWLTSEKEGTGQAVWKFTVARAGTCHLWVREFTKSWANPTRWRLDDGEFRETPRSLQPGENLSLGAGRGVGWADYGTVDLAKGDHALTFQIVPGRTVGKPDKEPGKDAIWAVDALCLTSAAEHPKAKAGEPLPTRLPNVQKARFDEVKAADPGALTWTILTAQFHGRYHEAKKLPMRYYKDFVRWTDVVSFDHYPVTGWNQPGRLPEVGLATRQLVAMCPKGTPVWTVVEASDQDLAWTAKETRGPTAEEMRAEVWMAIAGGAKGIGYFTVAFNPFRWNHLTDEVKAEMKRTNAELTELAGPIVLGDTERGLTVTGDDTTDAEARGHAIQAIRKDYQGKTYVVAVNVTRQKVTPRLTLEGVTAAKAAVCYENRNVRLTGGALSDTFEPLAVHVYVVD